MGIDNYLWASEVEVQLIAYQRAVTVEYMAIAAVLDFLLVTWAARPMIREMNWRNTTVQYQEYCMPHSYFRLFVAPAPLTCAFRICKRKGKSLRKGTDIRPTGEVPAKIKRTWNWSTKFRPKKMREGELGSFCGQMWTEVVSQQDLGGGGGTTRIWVPRRA